MGGAATCADVSVTLPAGWGARAMTWRLPGGVSFRPTWPLMTLAGSGPASPILWFPGWEVIRERARLRAAQARRVAQAALVLQDRWRAGRPRRPV